MFPEKLLHFIWQTRRFDAHNLQDSEGNPIRIVQVGTLNVNQGPDFLNAKVEIGGIMFTGDVELHIDSGEWYRHGHHQDEKYNAVILHVSYTSNGAKIIRKDMSICPEIVLESRIATNLLSHYAMLQAEKLDIPCEKLFPTVAKDFHTKQWIESLGVERIGEKARKMELRLQTLTQDWEQVAWENLLVYMCGTVNAAAAQRLGEVLPFSIFKKYADNVLKMEALLLGASGLLQAAENDAFVQELTKEWTYLQAKHSLTCSETPFSYLRMRAANFPDIRLAQVAAIVKEYPQLTQLLEVGEIINFIDADFLPSEYWQTHYRLGKESVKKRKTLGQAQKELLMINFLAPLGFLYRNIHGKEDASEWVIHLLSILHIEKNSLTRIFMDLGFEPENALHSQGLIACKRHYCDEQKCLSCGIGNRLLR